MTLCFAGGTFLSGLVGSLPPGVPVGTLAYSLSTSHCGM